ncbi:MAG TPA: gliding motility-associated C-terminal domain-containing protein [Bacteroidales bacterium]|nr:gliding motility-associated C-terminal domain-containing protein [Bacteroidales bacterium]
MKLLKFTLLFLLIFCLDNGVKAQLSGLFATQDTICNGMSSTITVLSGLAYNWSPVTGLDTTGGNPVIATPASTTTYTVTYLAIDSNLIVNGNFSSGNTGFSSSYNYAYPNTTEGQYNVLDNPHLWNIGMVNCYDHTLFNNDEMMMCLNGSPIPNTSVYCQTVNVAPNTDYAFSTWLATISTGNPARLQFSINGVLVGSIFNASINACVWKEFYVIWNSGAATTATICIVNQNTIASGNDFALDDISFAKIVPKADSITITVLPNNTIMLSSAAGTNAQTKCINTAITNITYATTGATGATITGLPAGVTGSWAANVVSISGAPSVTGSFTYTITSTGGCGTVNTTGTITVKPNNTVSAASSTPTRCINTALTAITHSTTGATGIGTPTGLPAGVSAAWAANTITISGTPTVSGTFNYSIPLTGGCGTLNATGTITVTPNNTLTLTGGGTQTKCINTAITPSTYSTTGATGATVTGLPPGVTGNWASNVVNITGEPTVTGTFTYTVTLTGGCGTVSTTGTITVSPNMTVTAASSAPTLCIGTALTAITHTTTSATGIGAAIGLPGGVSAVWTSNTITISGTPTASGTFNYTIPLTGGCGTVTATGTITVNSPPFFSVCPQDITQNTDSGLCAAIVNYNVSITGTPVPAVTYTFSGATTGIGSGTGSNTSFNKGTTQVILIATNSCGTDTCEFSVTINDNEAPIIMCPPDIITCYNQVTLGNATATDNCGWYLISNNAPGSFPDGTTTVTWTAIDSSGNTSSCDQTVTISDITATADGTQKICFDVADGTITITATGGTGNYYYSLSGDSAQTSNVFTGLPSGSYNITVTDSVTGCSATTTFTILMNSEITIDSVSQINANCFGRDGEMTISVEGGVSPYTYLWSNGSQTAHATGLNSGENSVTVTDAIGCTKSLTTQIGQDAEVPLKLNNVFTPNSNGINDLWIINHIELYPENELIVLNRWGNEVYSVKSYKNDWDGSNLSEGTYFYVLKVNVCGTEKTYREYITIIK